MKNIVENQGIKTDKPLPMSYEALKAERDALAVENAALKDVFGSGEAVVNFLSIALRHTKYDCIDLPDVALAFKMSLPETPATDAALAAIRDAVLDRVISKLSAMGSPDFTLMAVQALKNELREAK
ncbi:hypothetical protein [Serratia sp. (in: enterobacteria)]|uniref:hypothetical protein n=1 Tax=Serratia sp. (in: enterobacteria) TaxID=616 RepID=UPI0028BEFECD|nr:hypothetical protein [Serratia sp. (in: enterobacteria)]